jgi:hypothetical protein
MTARQLVHPTTCIASTQTSSAIPSTLRPTRTHLARGNTPHLEVITDHELLRNAFPQIPEDPFFEILRLDGGRCRAVLRGVDEAFDCLNLEVDGQGGDVVLVWVYGIPSQL